MGCWRQVLVGRGLLNGWCGKGTFYTTFTKFGSVLSDRFLFHGRLCTSIFLSFTSTSTKCTFGGAFTSSCAHHTSYLIIFFLFFLSIRIWDDIRCDFKEYRESARNLLRQIIGQLPSLIPWLGATVQVFAPYLFNKCVAF